MPSVAARERGREVPKAQTNLAQVTQSPALVTGWCDKICAKSNLRKIWLHRDKGLSWWGGMGADPSHLQLQQESENEPEVHVQTLKVSRL